MKSKQIIAYHEIINSLLAKLDICPNWSKSGVSEPDGPYNSYWWSDPDVREVCIPKPINKYRFMVCLHEIGHIVKKLRKHQYYQEFIAEEWAIKTAKRYGIRSSFYEKRAAAMLVDYIKSDIKQGFVTVDNLKPGVISFIRKNKIKITKSELKLI